MTQGQLVDEMIVALNKAGFVIVRSDLIMRLSDYFHLNARPENDLAQGFMKELDAFIGPPTIKTGWMGDIGGTPFGPSDR